MTGCGIDPPRLPIGPIHAEMINHNGRVQILYTPPPAGSDQRVAGSRWTGFKVLRVSRPDYDGPVLIRGRRLDVPGAVGFEQARVPLAELQSPSGRGGGEPLSTHGSRNWPSTARVRSPGCYGLQIDGTTFSTVVVFQATAQRA
jgi:hypothetical protein